MADAFKHSDGDLSSGSNAPRQKLHDLSSLPTINLGELMCLAGIPVRFERLNRNEDLLTAIFQVVVNASEE